MSKKFTSRSGLSLLELLVSLALMSLIAVGLAGAFGLGNQLWSRTQDLNKYNQEIALRQQLRHFIRQALPPTRLVPFNSSFVGDASNLRFLTLANTSFSDGAAAARISINDQDGALRLKIELLDDDGAIVDAIDDQLASQTSGVTFEYFGNASTEWVSKWEDTARLPTLIRIRVDEGSLPPWPDFVVKTRLQ